jgi:hypothetical protein
VLDASAVEVDRRPGCRFSRVEREDTVGVVGVAEPVPRRVDERVHRVGLTSSRTTARGALDVKEQLVRHEWTLARGLELRVSGSSTGRSDSGTGNQAARVAVDDGNGVPQ